MDLRGLHQALGGGGLGSLLGGACCCLTAPTLRNLRNLRNLRCPDLEVTLEGQGVRSGAGAKRPTPITEGSAGRSHGCSFKHQEDRQPACLRQHVPVHEQPPPSARGRGQPDVPGCQGLADSPGAQLMMVWPRRSQWQGGTPLASSCSPPPRNPPKADLKHHLQPAGPWTADGEGGVKEVAGQGSRGPLFALPLPCLSPDLLAACPCGTMAVPPTGMATWLLVVGSSRAPGSLQLVSASADQGLVWLSEVAISTGPGFEPSTPWVKAVALTWHAAQQQVRLHTIQGAEKGRRGGRGVGHGQSQGAGQPHDAVQLALQQAGVAIYSQKIGSSEAGVAGQWVGAPLLPPAYPITSLTRQGHECRQLAVVYSAGGLSGPGHTAGQLLHPQGDDRAEQVRAELRCRHSCQQQQGGEGEGAESLPGQPGQAVLGSPSSAGVTEGSVVEQVLLLLQGLHAHVDSRLDSLQAMMGQQGQRLAAIESRLRG
ncbi:hypothetical protein V8C86DRAFT_2449076 [Haematococcus lacustris]